jgi:hypothetical protein
MGILFPLFVSFQDETQNKREKMVATLGKWEGRLDMTTAKEINRTTKIS